jgi:hypothetical protein
MTAGATGQPYRRIRNPSRPITSRITRSSGSALTANEPSEANIRMPAYR